MQLGYWSILIRFQLPGCPGHFAVTSAFQYSLSNVNGVTSMFRERSVLPGMRSSHSWLIFRECACPSVCEPLNVVSCSEPPQWQFLKNGIPVIMSLTDCVCGDGRPNVASNVAASHRPGLMYFRTFGPSVTSTADAAAY